MTKQEAIKAASNLLQRIYHNDSGIPNDAVIAVLNAKADGMNITFGLHLQETARSD